MWPFLGPYACNLNAVEGHLVRRLLICVVIAGFALPCAAAKRMSVVQLEKLLTSDTPSHKKDIDIAKHLAEVEMTERISQGTYAELRARLVSQPKAALALRLLTDESQFLELPASETMGGATPGSTEQARLLEAARGFALQTLPGLPNFLATRTISLYDDTPYALKKGDWPQRAGLHPDGASNTEISVTRERANQPPRQGSAVWGSKLGLVSGGEFGTTLGMILSDMAGGTVSWNYWERAPGGLLAVFHYSVPVDASHFELISAYQREANLEGYSAPSGGRGVASIGVRQNVHPTNVLVDRTKVAYHGLIWINSANGTIERLTLVADTEKGLPFRRAAMMVQYGPVEIAGSTYICPVRSLALSEALANAESLAGNAPTKWLNETVFTNYHRFGSSVRIVEEADGVAPTEQAPAAGEPMPAEESAQANAAVPATPTTATTSAPTPEPGVEPSAATEAARAKAPETDVATPAALGAPVTATAASAPAAPVKTETVANSETASGAAAPADAAPSGFTLHLTVNSLLVPAVVTDKSGKAIADLGKDDFEVMDGRNRLPVTGITVVRSAKSARDAGNGESPAGGGDTTQESLRSGRRFIVFLFDDRHLTAEDLPRVQKAATQLLAEPMAATDYADVLSLMGISSGVTQDRAVLQAAVSKLSMHQAFQHGKEDCPDVDYYSADQILRQHNPMEFQIAVEKEKQCTNIQFGPSTANQNIYGGMANPTDEFQRAAMAAAARALAVGDEDARDSLAGIQSVVRAMAKLPGQRVLILVSPGFLTLSPETMRIKSEIMDQAAASQVILNSMDARGLYTDNMDASQGGNTSMIGLMTGQPQSNKTADMAASENAMSELADGTGGHCFHNSNDLKGGLETLTAAPEDLYLLEVSLKDVKATGTYHALKVKVNRPHAEVVARRGFVAPKPENGKKQSH